MSVVAYGNGTADSPQIVFSHCKVTAQREAIYDGPAYLWTRMRFTVTGLFDHGATAYEHTGDPVNNNTRIILSPLRAGRGANFASTIGPRNAIAPVTDVAIRHALMRPRQRLLVTTGAVDIANVPALLTTDRGGALQSCLLVESPFQPGNRVAQGDNRIYTTDANNGPLPIGLPIVRIDGSNTLHVSWAVETCVHEAHLYVYKVPICLSHQWEMSHDVDKDAFTERVINGRIVFRSDVLAQQATKPDDYRRLFCHSVPDNFRRESVNVRAIDDGNKLVYRIVDREKSHMLLFDNITRMEGTAEISQGHVGFENFLWDFVLGLGGVTSWSPAPGATAGGAMGGFTMPLMGAASNIRQNLPKLSIDVVIRAWGNKNATRRQLDNACMAALRAKLPSLFVGGRNFDQQGFRTTLDLYGRFVQATASLAVPPLRNHFAGAENWRGRFPDLLEDEIANVATTANTPGKSVVPGRIDRGTYLEIAVAQALWDGNVNPPAVAATRATQDKATLVF